MNSKVKHTPGSWEVTVYAGDKFSSIVANHKHIAAVRSAADARLIAKAPALAEALAWALDELEAEGDSLDPDFRAALEAARQTLNDALGA